MTLFLGVLFLTASLFQCTKVGDNIQHLDRSYPNTPDSSIYAAFPGEFTIATADAPARINDIIKMRGVQTILHEYCATSNCHGGPISPIFNSYADIMKYVVPAYPEKSKLWEMITTNDFNKAMPPVNSNHELTTSDKAIIFNWIYNGAKETPNLSDFRPAAIRLIKDGCGSANCHNQGTATGGWARNNNIPGLVTGDTVTYTYYNPGSGSVTNYCQLVKKAILDTVWEKNNAAGSGKNLSYKDSVKLFYKDTLGNASFRPVKNFSSPWVSTSTSTSVRGALGNYDDIIMDITYPKNVRNLSGSSSAPFIWVNGVKCYSKGNFWNSNDCFIRRIDTTLIYKNVWTGADQSTDGSMAWDDGGLKPSEVALIKAWYFGDPNIPDRWKYGPTETGGFPIYRYKATGKEIKR